MIKTFLLPVLLIGVSIALLLMYALPQYETLQLKLAEKVAYENALAQASEILSLKEGLRIQYDSFTQENRAKLLKMLPDKADVIGTILQTDDIAAQNGSVVISVKDTLEPASRTVGRGQDAVRTASTSYGVVSNYKSFLSFLRELERSLRITDISALSFDSTPETGESNLLDFSLDTNTYWLSE